MAKQQSFGADQGLIAASANLAASQQPVDLAGAFMKSFGVATEKFEAERQKITDGINTWMSQLKTDIDFTTMSPEMEAEVRNYLTTAREEYADLASLVAKSTDRKSKEYMDAVDRMNAIQREFVTLSKEITTYNQEKVNTAENFRKDLYSKGNDLDLLNTHRSIYGLSEEGTASLYVEDGHLFFDVNGEGKRYDKIQSLTMPNNLPITIADRAAYYSEHGKEVTEQRLNSERESLNAQFKNNDAFVSTLFDQNVYPLDSIKEEYLQAKENGTLEEVLPDLKRRTVEMIVQGYQETAMDSAAKAEEERQKRLNEQKDNPTGTGYDSDQRSAITRFTSMGSRPFTGPGQTGNIGFTIPGYGQAVYSWNSSTGKFIQVYPSGHASQYQPKPDSTGGYFELEIAEVAQRTGIREKDIRKALGLN